MWYWLALAIISILLMFSIVHNIKKIMGAGEESTSKKGKGKKSGNNSFFSKLGKSESVARSPKSSGTSRPSRGAKLAQDSKPSIISSVKSAATVGKKQKKLRWKIILSDTEILEDYEFVFYDSVGIGRKKTDHDFEDFLMINDPKVSKVHCSIYSDEEGLSLQDEGSSNSTFINGKKIRRPVHLDKGDVIGLGNTTLEVLKIFRETR